MATIEMVQILVLNMATFKRIQKIHLNKHFDNLIIVRDSILVMGRDKI